jgi:hypothetical protein
MPLLLSGPAGKLLHYSAFSGRSTYFCADKQRLRIVSTVGKFLPVRFKPVPTKHRKQTAGAFDYSLVWNALDQIRKSRAMSGCQRLAQLLNFVVEATLKGEASHLKETTIGVFVFGRRPDYNPKVDTIVRSQAWRLRAKLKEYYSSEGAQDPVIINLPLGSYVPVFKIRSEEKEVS